MGLAAQASFDDLGTPLAAVTFVVLDLETTGAAPTTDRITEIGALRYRGGECLATFHTLVNPGVPIPPAITILTGITEAMVGPAPRIEAVLPSPLELLDGAVLVGHNVRFDAAFLDAALRTHGYPPLRLRRVDTLALARRLLREEVPDLRLATLARQLRVSVLPCHRALEDARATVEVLHALLERAATFGVLGLDDLLALPSIRAHPSAGKLARTARLPRRPGVYRFLDRARRVLYVGKATNLRSRVRSYFSGDDRRKVPQLLRETESIDWTECGTELEAAVREAREIRAHEPRFNRRGKSWRRYGYVKLTLGERFPRVAVVRAACDDEGLHVGPLASSAAAHALKDAIETAVPLRRCGLRIGRELPGIQPCATAQMGAACCPCSGATSETDYAWVVARARRGLTEDARLLLDPLEARMHAMADVERFEDAARSRDRLRVIVAALERQRLLDWLRSSGRLRIVTGDTVLEAVDGRLRLDGDVETGPALLPVLPQADADELLVVARWLRREVAAGRVRVVDESGAPVTLPSPALERYDATPRRGIRRGR